MADDTSSVAHIEVAAGPKGTRRLLADPTLRSGDPDGANLLFTDGATQRELHRLLAIHCRQPRLTTMTGDACGKLAANCVQLRQQGHGDFVSDVWHPFLVHALVDVFELGSVFGTLAEQVLPSTVRVLEADAPTTAHSAMRQLVIGAARILRRNAGGGLWDVLGEQIETGELTVEQAATTVAVLVHGGYENPLLLATNLVEHVVNGGTLPDSTDEDVVDETLRHFGPVQHVRREHDGVAVSIALHDANHDATAFPSPNALMPARTERHVAFGAGTHRCPAANLAELQVCALLEQLPVLELHKVRRWDTDRHCGWWTAGAVRCHLRW